MTEATEGQGENGGTWRLTPIGLQLQGRRVESGEALPQLNPLLQTIYLGRALKTIPLTYRKRVDICLRQGAGSFLI